MKLIKPNFKIIHQEAGLEDIYKQIERAGRTCYKSEDKITEGSAIKFTNMMVNSGHGAMLEHGTVYLKMEGDEYISNKYKNNKYSKVYLKYSDTPNIPNIYNIPSHYITTNYRVLIENGWLDDLKYLCEPTEYHKKRITVRFTCDRGISHEFVRHRVFSFAQESTRYCNYSKDKFGNELTFIIPCWIDLPEGVSNLLQWENFYNSLYKTENRPAKIKDTERFLLSLEAIESYYFMLIQQFENKWAPQQARAILPNALKTELVMTGFVSDWKHFFKLRCDKTAHPQARELAIPLQEEFKRLNLI